MDGGGEMSLFEIRDWPSNPVWREILRDCDPHDVEIRIKYKDGREVGVDISWGVIWALSHFHNRSAVAEAYEHLLYEI